MKRGALFLRGFDTFNLTEFEHDTTPLGYFITIIAFIYFSDISRIDTSRELSNALAELTKLPAFSAGILEEAASAIAETGCTALKTHRVGIWTTSDEARVYKSVACYDMPTGKHSLRDDFGPNVRSMLFAPIRTGGKLAGVVSIEQDRCTEIPNKREWTKEEQNFASSLADSELFEQYQDRRESASLHHK